MSSEVRTLHLVLTGLSGGYVCDCEDYDENAGVCIMHQPKLSIYREARSV